VNWDVDFKTNQLIGSVTHDLEVRSDTDYLVLDSWLINVGAAELLPAGSAMAMQRLNTDEHTVHGTPLAFRLD
jgi:hypothetical protein